MPKKVNFNLEQNQTFDTYTKDEYDRYQIRSVLYFRTLNHISDSEWYNIFKELNLYKALEMIVHKDSIKYTRIH